MKLWNITFTCFLLLSSVSTSPLFQGLQKTKRSHREHISNDSQMKLDMLDPRTKSRIESVGQQESSVEKWESIWSRSTQLQSSRTKAFFSGLAEDWTFGACSANKNDNMAVRQPEQFEDVVEFIKATISRLRRSPEWEDGLGLGEKQEKRSSMPHSGARGQREDRRGPGRGGGGGGGGGGRRGRGRGRGQGCVLKQIHLNVTDLGLGYQTKEELIFKYCTGSCVNSLTNYDKILNNLTQNKKLQSDTPPLVCCRPIAFDDDLSFLDDNLMYHTMRRHSARKCGCV